MKDTNYYSMKCAEKVAGAELLMTLMSWQEGFIAVLSWHISLK